VFGGTQKIKQEQSELTATKVESGVNTLLEKWGVKMGSEVLADARCARVPYVNSMGQQIPAEFPPIPIISFDEEQSKHPIAYRLDQVIMPFGATLSQTDALKGDKEVTATVIARSSERAWLIEGDNVDLKPRSTREWRMSNKRGVFPVAIALEGKLPSAFAGAAPRGPARAIKSVHVFVVASSGFVRDEFLPPADRANPADLNRAVAFGLNGADWLAQEDELIAIRAKSVEEPMIEVPATVQEAEEELKSAASEGDRSGAEAAVVKRKEALEDWDAKRSRIKLINIALWPLLFIAFGLVRWQLRRKKRANISL